jgi:enoyl-CoA hydratase/carnithine racemase
VSEPPVTDPVLRRDQDDIATLTLNAPQSLNALSRAMLIALQSALTDLAQDDSIRVVILRAEGRAFSAGHDLKEIEAARSAPDGGKAEIASLFDLCARVMQMLPALPQPVIASVQGVATAAGCQLACSADLVVAAENARFGVNGINLGLFCSTPAVALSRRIAPSQAFELLTTGEFLTASSAQAIGLVNRLATPEALEAETLALARQIAAKDPGAIRLGKAAFRSQLGLPPDQAYVVAGSAMVENALRPETAAGIQAFLDRQSAKS